MGFNKFGRSGRGFQANRRSFGDSRVPPVKVGDELDVTIETVAGKGDGLTRKDGFVIFVPGTKQGDKVRIRITKVLRRVGFAEKISGSEQQGEAQPTQEESGEEAEESYEGVDTENFGEEPEQEQQEEQEQSENDLQNEENLPKE